MDKMPQLVVTSTSFSRCEQLCDELIQVVSHSKFNQEGLKLREQQLVEFIGEAEILIVGTEPITEVVIKSCPRLKFFSKYGVGLDNIDFKACEKAGIDVKFSSGMNKLSVAEMVLGFMLGLSRNLYESSIRLKRGQWFKQGGFQLSGKTIGIIGVGNVGKEVIRLLTPFNCTLLVNDIIDQSEYYCEHGCEDISKEELYARSDIISLQVPLTEKTTHMINKKILSSMKSSSILINTARGEVVCQDDLKEALMSKEIVGAAIDVYEDEPPEDQAFLNLPNLFCTAHIGGNAKEAVLAMGRGAIDGVKSFF